MVNWCPVLVAACNSSGQLTKMLKFRQTYEGGVEALRRKTSWCG